MVRTHEKKLLESGFNKLQEKEDMVYYEKLKDNTQIFAIYDKNNEKITSVDMYSFSDMEMKIIPSKQSLNELNHILKSS
jgi:hypothetical protein